MRRILIGAVVARAVACATACAVAAGGCACESRIGIQGDTGMDNEAGDTSFDTAADPDGWSPDVGEFDPPVAPDVPLDVPSDAVGDPGWGDSVTPWCNPTGALGDSMSVWSEPAAVNLLLNISPGDGPHGMSIVYRNDGTGWRQWSGTGSDSASGHDVWEIEGVPGGSFLFGHEMYGRSLVSTITGAGFEWGDIRPLDVFVVNDNLAYALVSEAPGLMKWNGESWGPYPGEPLSMGVDVLEVLWADESVVYCGGSNGIVMSNDGTGWYVHDTMTTVGITGLWGFSADDVWAITEYAGGAGTPDSKVLHFDGADWSEITWPYLPGVHERCAPRALMGMWGKDGVVFFWGGGLLLEWNGTGFETIGYWPAAYDEPSDSCVGGLGLVSVWGNDVDEVFLALQGTAPIGAGCGREFLLRWDGSEFHWF